jgi:predicted aspartyl protease
MSLIRYQYVTNRTPPAPFVHVRVQNPATGALAEGIAAQLDTAADRTVISKQLAEQLHLTSVRDILIAGLGGEVHTLEEYVIQIQIHEFGPLLVSVVAHPTEPYLLLGRDVLNQFRIVLDGPRLIMEIG